MVHHSKNKSKLHDAIGVPIDPTMFRETVLQYLERIERRDEFQPEDYVVMARMWNTIDLGGLAKTDALYRRYAETFFPDLIEEASRALGATPTKGMALYSKTFDLYIGGKPHSNSQYRLLTGIDNETRR